MLVVFIIVILIGVYVYIRKKYFTLRSDLPGLSPHLLFGNLLQSGLLTKKVSIPEALLTFKKRFGDVYQFWLGPSRYIVVSNLTDVSHIFSNRNIYEQGQFFIQQIGTIFPDSLLCITGSRHKRHAALILPIFRRTKTPSNVELIIDCVDQMLMQWRERPQGAINTDIHEQLQNLLLQIFGFVGFDYDFQSICHETKNSTDELVQALQDITKTFEIITFTPPWISKQWLKYDRRYCRAIEIVNKYIYRMIEQENEASPESRAIRKRTSLIASLVASLQNDEAKEALKSEEEKKGLSRREVLHEMLLFLMAGSDTTASAASWVIYFLSKYPRVQNKIKAELNERNLGGYVSLDQLDSLTYLDCVIKEVLRYVSPLSGSIRTLTMDDRLPASNVQLRKGESIFIPFHNLAFDSRYWSIDPIDFYPERFLSQDEHHPNYAWIPFGGGHRQCIGQDFARFELKVIVSRLMQHVTFGDGGPDANSGGQLQRFTVTPKKIGVTLNFS